MELLNIDVDVQTLIDEAHDLAEAFEDGKSCNPEEMAGKALLLARLNDEVLEALEALKEALREHARPLLPEGETVGTVEVPGVAEGLDLGCVTVTFPAVVVKIDKKANVERLKRTLGSAFSDYFEERVTYSPHKDFQERTEAALSTDPSQEAAEARLALGVVSVDEATPRVGFKPL
jgi:hypothetical protein